MTNLAHAGAGGPVLAAEGGLAGRESPLFPLPSGSREELMELLRSAPLGIVRFRPDGGITLANPTAARLLAPLAPDADGATPEVERDRRLQADERRFRAIFDNLRDCAICTVGPDGRIDG